MAAEHEGYGAASNLSLRSLQARRVSLSNETML